MVLEMQKMVKEMGGIVLEMGVGHGQGVGHGRNGHCDGSHLEPWYT